MFIKNYSNESLVINYHSSSRTLEANTVTYVDDNWISVAMIKAMFGDYVEEVNYNIPLEQFLFDDKVEIQLDNIYLVDIVGPSNPRIFVEDARVDIYFYDGEDTPNVEDMILFTNYTNVEGLIKMEEIPRWILIKAHDSWSKPKILMSNVEVRCRDEVN